MSTPSSRLSAYSSYSYYHVLVMCDSTNTAALLASSSDNNIWEHATPETEAPDQTGNTQQLGGYSPKCISADQDQCAGRYCVLINGSTDAGYVIDAAQWYSTTASPAVDGDANTSIAVEGSIAISEPKGVAFLDQIVNCSIALGIPMAQAVFVLKTFFVGHVGSPDIDNEVTPVITDIPPITFVVVDAEGTFTEAGGTYQLEFVAVTNGQARLPQYSNAVTSMSITAGETLQATVDRLQSVIQKSYQQYFACTRNQILSIGTPDAQRLADSLAQVEYKFELDPVYRDSRYRVTDQPSQFKNTPGCDQPAKFVFPPNTSIESALHAIMHSSNEVQQDAASGDPGSKIKYEYRIQSTVESTPVNNPQSSPTFKYTVRYRISRFINPKQIARSSLFEQIAERGEPASNSPEFDQLRRNLIEFDYLYTGRNIDILDFQIKVSAGLVYLQTATLVNTFKTGVERTPTTLTQPSDNDLTNMGTGLYRPGATAQVPVFFGKQITSTDYTNTSSSSTSMQHAFTLSQHASLEVAQASMTIIGNDLLLSSTNRGTGTAGIRPPDEVQAGAPDGRDFGYWTHAPAYARISIRMPRNNDDESLFLGRTTDGDTSADYAQPFWYDGFYYIVGVEHKFTNGTFTQQLELVAIQQSKNFVDNTQSQTAPIETSEAVADCFASRVECGGSPAQTPTASGSGSTVVPAQPVSPPDEMSLNDSRTLIKSQGRLDQIKGWAAPFERVSASPAVKTAILDAARDIHVDPFVLASFAYQESKFRPSATAPSNLSNALGLYQFVPGSWSTSVLGSRDPILTPSVLAVKSNRLDPRLNARAGAIYLKNNARIIGSNEVGDLYLAHFMGAGGSRSNNGAWRILNEDRNGRGHLPISAVLSEGAVKQIVANDPRRLSSNTTVRQLREWAANKMAGALLPSVTTPKANRPVTNTNQTLTNTSTAEVQQSNVAPTSRDRISQHTACAAESKTTEEVQQCNQQPPTDQGAPQ